MQRSLEDKSKAAVSATFGLALAGTIAAASIANPAAAAGVVHSVKCALSTTCYTVSNTGSGDAIDATATTGIAVNAVGSNGFGMQATSNGNGTAAINAVSKAGNGLQVRDGGSSAASGIVAVDATVGGFGIISQATNKGVAGYFVNNAAGGTNTSPALLVQSDLTKTGNPVAQFFDSLGNATQSFNDTRGRRHLGALIYGG